MITTHKRQEAGFTLIELMMAIAIIGILLAIAIPNYQTYLRKTVCEDAKATMTGAANVMERFRAQNNTYTGADLGAYASSPVDGASKHFQIAISASDASTYTLTATPLAGGRMGEMAATATITLASTGQRGGTGGLATAWDSCSGL